MTVGVEAPAFAGGWGAANGQTAVKAPAPLKDFAALADRVLIEQTVVTYAWALDERQWHVLREIITDDMWFEGDVAGVEHWDRVTGADELVPWLEGIIVARDDQLRHHLSNVIVTDQTADSATAQVYLLLTGATTAGVRPLATAFYRLTLVKRGETWAVSSMYAGFDTSF